MRQWADLDGEVPSERWWWVGLIRYGDKDLGGASGGVTLGVYTAYMEEHSLYFY